MGSPSSPTCWVVGRYFSTGNKAPFNSRRRSVRRNEACGCQQQRAESPRGIPTKFRFHLMVPWLLFLCKKILPCVGSSTFFFWVMQRWWRSKRRWWRLSPVWFMAMHQKVWSCPSPSFRSLVSLFNSAAFHTTGRVWLDQPARVPWPPHWERSHEPLDHGVEETVQKWLFFHSLEEKKCLPELGSSFSLLLPSIPSPGNQKSVSTWVRWSYLLLARRPEGGRGTGT